MTQKEIAFRIEELQLSAERIHSLQNALFTAIFRQDEFSIKDFEWAFIVLGEMTFDAKEELNNLKEKAFKNLKKDG